MPEQNPMLCPVCGVVMNHHADKIDYNAMPDDPATADPVWGGIIEQAHTCPECGQTFVRPEQAGA